MRIIIPTRGRTNQQITLQSLPSEWRKRTIIVCPKIEAFKLGGLDERLEIVAQPDPDWTIAQKRKWIIEEWSQRGYERILMFDDDLCFATRIGESDWRLREIRGEELGPYPCAEYRLVGWVRR
jgi:hypothetical protein